MKHQKPLLTTLLGAVLVAWGSAQAVQYYNLTQLEAETTTYVPNPAIYNTAYINGAVFTTTVAPQIVGTGVLDPFIRIQATHDNALNINQGANCNNNTGEGCVEVAYNTNGATSGPLAGKKPDLQAKDNQGSNWNKTLELANMQKTCDNSGPGGTNWCYYTFVLDINERLNKGGADKLHDQMLSLDQFRIFTSATDANVEGYYTGASELTSGPIGNGPGGTGDLAGVYDPTLHRLGGASGLKAVFDMDVNNAGVTTCANPAGAGNIESGASPQQYGTTGNPTDPSLAPYSYAGSDGRTVCDRTVGLNYALNSGSGNGVDLVVKVPDTVFIGSKYVYLLSSFGELGINDDKGGTANQPAKNLPAGDFSQSAGFEEWSTVKNKTPIAPTLALLLVGLAAMNGVSRARIRRQLG